MPRQPNPQFDPIESPGLVLCEGLDDVAFLVSMLRDIGVSRELVLIESLDGRPQLFDRLNGLVLRDSGRRLKALGIICDTDAPDDGPASFGRLRDTLRRAGFSPPTRAGEISRGRWSDGRNLTIGTYVMPDNVVTGALEDLLLRAVSVSTSIRCVDDFLECVSTVDAMTWRPQDRAKARVNAWLASRSDPTLRLQRAFTPQLIDPKHQSFDDIKGFLRQLAAAAGT